MNYNLHSKFIYRSLSFFIKSSSKSNKFENKRILIHLQHHFFKMFETLKFYFTKHATSTETFTDRYEDFF